MNSNAKQTCPIQTILSRLDEIEANVSQRRKKVERFVTKIKDYLNCDAHSSWLRGSQFILTGGSSEGTAVKENSDFDVIMLLPSPFTLDYFKAVPVGSISGVYKLRYFQVNPIGSSNASCSEELSQKGFLFEGAFIPYEFDDGSDDGSTDADSVSTCSVPAILDEFLNKDDFLLVGDLKKSIFVRLQSALSKLQNNEPAVTYIVQESQSSLKVTIRAPCGYDIKMDLVPQIGGELLIYIHENVRNSIRLAKAIAKHHGWTSMGLLSYHIKRTAINLYDQLDVYNPFLGCITMLNQLANMLEVNKIDGVIIKDQDIMIKDAVTGYSLAQMIREFNQSTNKENILLVLTEYI